MQGSALGGAAGGGWLPECSDWGPEWPQVAFFGGRAGDGHGVGRRVVMGTSGGTSLCSQSGKHFRELGWVGDCLIIEEPQPDFLYGKQFCDMEFICVPQVGIQIKSHKNFWPLFLTKILSRNIYLFMIQ